MMNFRQQDILLVANSSCYLFNFKSELIVKLKSEGFVVYYFSLDDTHYADLKKIGCRKVTVRNFRSKILNFLAFCLLTNSRSIGYIYSFTLVGVVMGSLIQSLKTDRAKIYATVTGLGNVFLYPFIGPTVSKIIYRMALWNAHYVFVQTK